MKGVGGKWVSEEPGDRGGGNRGGWVQVGLGKGRGMGKRVGRWAVWELEWSGRRDRDDGDGGKGNGRQGFGSEGGRWEVAEGVAGG